MYIFILMKPLREFCKQPQHQDVVQPLQLWFTVVTAETLDMSWKV
jgi:hypothetical protein